MGKNEEGLPDIRVLLVEDNPGDARLVSLMLSGATDATYAVACARNLDEAVRLHGGRGFDVVLTDLCLPDSPDNKATVDAVLRTWADTPIVVLTGQDDPASA